MSINVKMEHAFVLHSMPYLNSSLLINLFTLQFGRLFILAKGAKRKKSNLQGVLMPFLPLLVSYGRKNNQLSILHHAEIHECYKFPLSTNTELLFSGLYMNELLVKLIPVNEPYPNLYNIYQQTLNNIRVYKKSEIYLRLFEKHLLSNIGYGLELNYEINGNSIISNKWYNFEYGNGFSLTKSSFNEGSFFGKNLLALRNENLLTYDEIKDAKRLLNHVIFIILGSKKLNSINLLYA